VRVLGVGHTIYKPMYKILGADGKEYGPVNLDQMRQWVSQGRVNALTKVQKEGSTEWRTATEFPEIQALLASPAPVSGATAPSAGTAAPAPRKQGLAITSFVLGLLSILCFGILTGIPAIITGHRAHNRARRDPVLFGGGGFAIAGFIMGYLSILITLLALAMVLPALAKAKAKATEIKCASNLQQIGAAFQMFAMDHEDQFPFSVEADAGGTKEQAKDSADGFATDPTPHFKALADQLNAGPAVLICPSDNKRPAASFDSLTSQNITYRLRTVSGIENNSEETLLVCPIHNQKLMADGSVQKE